MKNIHQIRRTVTTKLSLAMASELVLALLITMITLGHASAGQMTARSVEISDSGVSGGSITTDVGDGLGVVYKVSFTPSATIAVGGVVVDFCSNSALVGDTCIAPAGFNVNRSTTAVASQTAGCGAGTLATYTSDTTNNRIIVTRGTAAATSGACSIELGNGTTTGFTNPTSNGTFYARIYTYGTAAAAQAHSTVSPTGYIDFGAAALSIANVITITARVQESMIFCVSAAAPTSNCGGTSTPSLTLGHGTTKAIDSTAVDTGSAYTQISTNATSGATVRMHSAYSCGGLSVNGGTTCGIPAAGSGAATAAAITAGTAAFGLYVAPGAAISGGSGVTASDANYYNASHTTIATDLWYGMDTTTSGSNTTTSYGDNVLSATGPVNNVNAQLVFAATASNVTPAGLYTTNLSLIAVGIF